MGTKIHAAAALANPVRLIDGPGQQYDITRAEDLINGSKAGAVIADKGYDANKLEAKIAEQGSELVIPPKRKRKSPRAYNKDLYKDRDLIERFFAKLKQFRRVLMMTSFFARIVFCNGPPSMAPRLAKSRQAS